jgi:hypothetical protein
MTVSGGTADVSRASCATALPDPAHAEKNKKTAVDNFFISGKQNGGMSVIYEYF